MSLYFREDDKQGATTENKAFVYLPCNIINRRKAIQGPLNSEHSVSAPKRRSTI